MNLSMIWDDDDDDDQKIYYMLKISSSHSNTPSITMGEEII